MTSKKSQPRRPHPLGLLHRYGGITSALLIIVICTTGILLNHTEEIGLAKTYVSSEPLLRWYGIEVPEATTYAANAQYLSVAGNRLYLDTQVIAGNYKTLNGLIFINNFLLASIDSKLLLLQPDGNIIETLENVHGIPVDIINVGLIDSLPTVATASGVWQSDSTLGQWDRLDNTDIEANWSRPVELPERFATVILNDQRGAGLPLERVILDLHSGRILGKAGPWIGDSIAILFISLALTGIWMWFKTRKR